MDQGTAPPVPFLLTRPKRFAPAYATTNADGAPGNGLFSGSWWIVGHLLICDMSWSWGTTTVKGTGDILCPFPPGFSSTDLDVNAMAAIGPFGSSQAVAAGGVNGVNKVIACDVLTTGALTILGGLLAELGAIIPGDILCIRTELPILEPAIRG